MGMTQHSDTLAIQLVSGQFQLSYRTLDVQYFAQCRITLWRSNNKLSQLSIVWDSDTMIIHHIDCDIMRFGLFLFISIPVIEMYILILVGSQIGALTTIALVVLTATIGLWLFRREGFATLHNLQSKLNRNELPGRELLEGVMLLIGGALLLTPGFVTDSIGFVCLLPGLRKPLAEFLIQRGIMAMTSGFVIRGAAQGGAPHGSSPGGGQTFDGEFTEHANPDADKIDRH